MHKEDARNIKINGKNEIELGQGEETVWRLFSARMSKKTLRS